jgi:hypothetical protein
MSQPSPLTSAAPAAPEAYRPLTGLAIASVALSGFFAVIVLASGVVALVKGAPVFLSTWLLLVPVAGVVLSVTAQWRIRRAEGTLAGTTLARWGWWLGLLSGLGYFAYYFATGLAIKQQANHFLMVEGEDAGFFPTLLKAGRLQQEPGDAWMGYVNRAFLLTVPYASRGAPNPDDQQMMETTYDRPGGKERLGALGRFRANEVVQALLQAGREGTVPQPLGVKRWDYKGQEYTVVRDYRITTSELQLDVAIPVIADIDPADGTRKWHVVMSGGAVVMLGTSHRTPLGEGLQRLRGDAREAVSEWAQNVTAGKAKEAPPRDATDWNNLRIQIQKTPAGRSEEEVKELARDEITALFKGKPRGPEGLMIQPQELCSCEDVGGRRRVTLTFQAGIGFTKPIRDPEFSADGELVVLTKERVDPLQFTSRVAWEPVEYRLHRITAVPSKARAAKQKMQGGAGG